MPRRHLPFRLRFVPPLLVGFAAGLLTGCDAVAPAPFERQVVVRALLVAGEPLPPLRFVESLRIDEVEETGHRPITDGDVTLRLLGADGDVEATYAYEPHPGGAFRPADEHPPPVLSGRTYELRGTFPGYEALIRAETTVPAAFEVVRAPADTIRYQVDPQPAFDVTPSTYPGREAVYVLTVEALEPDPAQLTPFASVLFENGALDMDDLTLGNSPLLGAENYGRNPDGTLALRIPWLMINFYGPHRFEVTALDDALVAFIRSQALQFNPSTLSPGEVPAAVSNVENGAGVFGAIAHTETTAYVARP